MTLQTIMLLLHIFIGLKVDGGGGEVKIHDLNFKKTKTQRDSKISPL